jgi:hypothetical protein
MHIILEKNYMREKKSTETSINATGRFFVAQTSQVGTIFMRKSYPFHYVMIYFMVLV